MQFESRGVIYSKRRHEQAMGKHFSRRLVWFMEFIKELEEKRSMKKNQLKVKCFSLGTFTSPFGACNCLLRLVSYWISSVRVIFVDLNKVVLDGTVPFFGFLPHLFINSIPSTLQTSLTHVSPVVACYTIQVLSILANHVADLLINSWGRNQFNTLNKSRNRSSVMLPRHKAFNDSSTLFTIIALD